VRTADTRKVVSFDGEGKRQSGNGVGIVRYEISPVLAIGFS